MIVCSAGLQACSMADLNVCTTHKSKLEKLKGRNERLARAGPGVENERSVRRLLLQLPLERDHLAGDDIHLKRADLKSRFAKLDVVRSRRQTERLRLRRVLADGAEEFAVDPNLGGVGAHRKAQSAHVRLIGLDANRTRRRNVAGCCHCVRVVIVRVVERIVVRDRIACPDPEADAETRMEDVVRPIEPTRCNRKRRPDVARTVITPAVVPGSDVTRRGIAVSPVVIATVESLARSVLPRNSPFDILTRNGAFAALSRNRAFESLPRYGPRSGRGR